MSESIFHTLCYQNQMDNVCPEKTETFFVHINVTIILHTTKQYNDDTMGEEQKTMTTPWPVHRKITLN